MTSRLRIGVLLVALVAMFAFASTAMAKGGGGGGAGSGGGGGGGGTCATLNNFTVTAGSNSAGATLTIGYSIFNGCVDEVMPAIGLNYTKDGVFLGRAVTMASFGLNQSTTTSPASYGSTYTISIDMYTPNGKLQFQQARTVTIPAAPAA
jgi:hypothetical protein